MRLRYFSNINSSKIKIISLIFVALVLIASISIEYDHEKDETLKGEGKFELTYSFKLLNDGPLNLTSVTLRLALLKDWEPVQTVESIVIHTKPNRTTSDEYENQFVWYEWDNFEVGKTLDLQFDVNLTLNLLDFSAANLKLKPYDFQNPQYKLFTKYHPLTDTTDPAVQNVASGLTSSENPLDIAFEAYNFSSTYINYRLLSEEKGASYAIRNAFGDCDEYTSLFVALLRSRGIPAIEHTAWLADFQEGFVTTDEGAAAHAYPMFYLEGFGMLPADPTRGNTNLFDNWLKTDEKRITMTRGPDQPYRKLVYRWIPIEGIDDPIVQSNYTISINKLDIEYFSLLRQTLIFLIIGIPVSFIVFNVIKGRKAIRENNLKREKLLSPTKLAERQNK